MNERQAIYNTRRHIGNLRRTLCYVKFYVWNCILARSQNCEKRRLASSCLSFCSSLRLFVRPFVRQSVGPHRTTRHQYTFLIIFRSILLWRRNVSDKVVEKIKTHFVTYFFFRRSCRLWENVENFVERGRPQMTIWCMRIPCWITGYKRTLRIRNTYCFSCATTVARKRLKWHHTYIACIVMSLINILLQE